MSGKEKARVVSVCDLSGSYLGWVGIFNGMFFWYVSFLAQWTGLCDVMGAAYKLRNVWVGNLLN